MHKQPKTRRSFAKRIEDKAMQKSTSEIRIDKIKQSIQESLHTQERFFSDHLEDMKKAFELVTRTLASGGKLIVMGNGGSAADAQHLAAELVNRYEKDRPALPSLALTTDSSVLTSIGNDSDFRFTFSRQIEALGKPGDLVLGITTSGNSPNVLEGIQQAKKQGISSIALTGGDGGRVKTLADLTLCVSSSHRTARIQETFLVLEHLLCEWIESELFPTEE